MLQQTRVATVVPYFRRFLRRFPILPALAGAPLDEVVRHWAGLGYYHRARHLHRAAKEIVRRHGGRFPSDYDQALALPGIGPYAAAAILSIAYAKPHAVLDGNVARVLTRLACLSGDMQSAAHRKKLQTLAEALLSQAAPGEFNQAMMELGATVCLPRRPLCLHCPIEAFCAARRAGLETVLPGKRQKLQRLPVELAVAVAERDGKVLFVCDHQKFFSRLWQFPAVLMAEQKCAGEIVGALLRRYGLRGRMERELGKVKHNVTHHDIRLRVFAARVDGHADANRDHARWIPLDEAGELPISSATKKVLALARAARGGSKRHGIER